jgi:hypothetical protein
MLVFLLLTIAPLVVEGVFALLHLSLQLIVEVIATEKLTMFVY